jgi:hypothetical protein
MDEIHAPPNATSVGACSPRRASISWLPQIFPLGAEGAHPSIDGRCSRRSGDQIRPSRSAGTPTSVLIGPGGVSAALAGPPTLRGLASTVRRWRRLVLSAIGERLHQRRAHACDGRPANVLVDARSASARGLEAAVVGVSGQPRLTLSDHFRAVATGTPNPDRRGPIPPVRGVVCGGRPPGARGIVHLSLTALLPCRAPDCPSIPRPSVHLRSMLTSEP